MSNEIHKKSININTLLLLAIIMLLSISLLKDPVFIKNKDINSVQGSKVTEDPSNAEQTLPVDMGSLGDSKDQFNQNHDVQLKAMNDVLGEMQYTLDSINQAVLANAQQEPRGIQHGLTVEPEEIVLLVDEAIALYKSDNVVKTNLRAKFDNLPPDGQEIFYKTLGQRLEQGFISIDQLQEIML